jgi:hypothetical protein
LNGKGKRLFWDSEGAYGKINRNYQTGFLINFPSEKSSQKWQQSGTKTDASLITYPGPEFWSACLTLHA